MLVRATRVVIGLVGTALLVLAGLAGYYGVWMLTTDDPDGGAHAVGLMVFPASLVAGVIALGLLMVATRR
jgi:hypothetical protein